MQLRPLPTEHTARLNGDQALHFMEERLALVSHELRTPLSAILNWAQVLQKSPTDKDIVMRSAEAIERNARVQAHLVNDLVDISRINVGKMQLKKINCDLDFLVRSTLLAVEHTVRAKRIKINYVASGRIFVDADERRLQQVITNLVDNAIKFTPIEGAITVALSLRDGSAVITVADNGCGFAPDLSSRLFEQFQQPNDGAQHEGLGLGLYIVKNIVELHGGTVTAHSTGPGEGATFTVRLPAAIELCTRHIEREKNELLPMAARLPTDDDLVRVGRAMRARRGIDRI